MTTIVSRRFRSTPERDAASTWTAIVDLLTRGKKTEAYQELLSVTGIAASLITDLAPKDDAITVVCDGPRTRIYCIYDEDAIDGSGANEDALGFDPLNGNWRVSLPCQADDLNWVQAALKEKSSRVTARSLEDEVPAADKQGATASAPLVLDPKGFLGS